MDMEERIAIQILMQKILDRYGGPVSLPGRDDGRNNPGYDPNDLNDPNNPNSPNYSPEYRNNNNNNFYDNDIDYEEDGNDDEDDEFMEPFRLFESAPRYGNLKNLMFDDSKRRVRFHGKNNIEIISGTRKFMEVRPDEMSYKSFLGKSYGGSLSPPFTAINGIRKCPVGQMTLCVTSQVNIRTLSKIDITDNDRDSGRDDQVRKDEDCLECSAFGAKDELQARQHPL